MASEPEAKTFLAMSAADVVVMTKCRQTVSRWGFSQA